MTSTSLTTSRTANDALSRIDTLRDRPVWRQAFESHFPLLDESTTCRITHLVLQGGGTLGIAHLGFIHGLERAGLRIAGIAGTSAGAIIALAVVACRHGSLSEPVSPRLMNLLATMPAASFIDGPYRVRRAIKYALHPQSFPLLEMLLPVATAARRLLRSFGLNPGQAFSDWLEDVLARDFGMRTIEDLDHALTRTAEALTPFGIDTRDSRLLLQIIATALPAGLKFNFPDSLNLLAPRYSRASPSLLARASMSIPLFFEPLALDLNPGTWPGHVASAFSDVYGVDTVSELAAASKVYFIDGGLLSNFPIDAFTSLSLNAEESHRFIPTIGVGLVSAVEKTVAPNGSGIGALVRHGGAVFNAIRHQRDRDARTFARKLSTNGQAHAPISVALIDVRGHNWLNFMLSPAQLRDLFERGLLRAERFLSALGN